MTMKKSSKRLALTTQTIRSLQNDELATVAGGSLGGSGPSVISQSTGTSVISVSGGTSVISGPSVISKSH